MKLKRIAASVGIALALGVAATAAQASQQYTDLVPGQTGVYTPIGTSGFTWTVALPNFSTAAAQGDLFTDTFNFSLASGITTASPGMLTAFLGLGAADTSSVTFTLWSGLGDSGWTQVGAAATPTPTAIFNGPYASGTSFSGLTAGTSYHLVVKGDWAQNLGSESGTYDTSGNQIYTYGLTISAVPEPETYAMFSFGLFLIGALAKRAKKEAI